MRYQRVGKALGDGVDVDGDLLNRTWWVSFLIRPSGNRRCAQTACKYRNDAGLSVLNRVRLAYRPAGLFLPFAQTAARTLSGVGRSAGCYFIG